MFIKDKIRISFRDPLGKVIQIQNRIIRVVNKEGIQSFPKLLASNAIKNLQSKGFLVESTVIGSQSPFLESIPEICDSFSEEDRLFVEHEKFPFPSYPYEWSAEMLFAAADLTLHISKSLFAENIGIKDATPFNIFFKGPKPVFIDLLSFEFRDPCDPFWMAYNQFHKTFMLPLLAHKYFKINPGNVFISKREGFTVDDLWDMCPSWRKILSPFLSLVTLPKWFSKKMVQDYSAGTRKKYVDDKEKSAYIFESFLNRIQKDLGKLCPPCRNSNWAEYSKENVHYSETQKKIKKEIISKFLEDSKIKSLVDIGCNTGEFSILAARKGVSVVAIDKDPTTIGKLWREAFGEKLDILPLVIDLSRPSPDLGWRNSEEISFLRRAKEKFEAVFALAIIHHLLVTERIPLHEIIRVLSEITTKYLIIEYVGPKDTMFKLIARGRDDLYTYLKEEVFKNICAKHFTLINSIPIEGSFRSIYIFKKK